MMSGPIQVTDIIDPINIKFIVIRYQTRPKKFAESGVCKHERADNVPLSRIQA